MSTEIKQIQYINISSLINLASSVWQESSTHSSPSFMLTSRWNFVWHCDIRRLTCRRSFLSIKRERYSRLTEHWLTTGYASVCECYETKGYCPGYWEAACRVGLQMSTQGWRFCFRRSCSVQEIIDHSNSKLGSFAVSSEQTHRWWQFEYNKSGDMTWY